MATTSQIQKLTSKAIFDNAFRHRFLSSPKKAAMELKIELTKNEISYIKSLDPDQIQALAIEIQQMTHTESSTTHWA